MGNLGDLFSLTGRKALVTGSSSGIGQAQAVALAEAGAQVVVHGTDAGKIERTRELIAGVGGVSHALAAPLDGNRASCHRVVADAAERMGGLDILINCAGTNRRKRIEDVEEDDWESILRVNLDSLFWLSQAACAQMREGGGGKLLHVGSLTTFRGLGMLGPYGATKAAVGLLTQTMAVEWARYNIQVNCLAPGFIETPLTAQGLFGDQVRRRWIHERVPARRPGYPSDLVGATVFLCSPASDFVTGQTLAVDGGFLTGGSWEQEPGD
jgi:NAD(P)-dependent dehydrogenase (short-subunit alcohol dehydrogenase family)